MYNRTNTKERRLSKWKIGNKLITGKTRTTVVVEEVYPNKFCRVSLPSGVVITVGDDELCMSASVTESVKPIFSRDVAAEPVRIAEDV